ncbi:MAG: hypothetical protein ACKO2L_10235 [Planctomycetaceae bacterium]
MKNRKLQWMLSGVLVALVTLFGVVMHQRIVSTASSPSMVEARVDMLAYACGQIVGGGLALIWFLPFLIQKFRKS